MKVLIKACKVINPSSQFHSKTVDIFIEDGIIKKIGIGLTDASDKTVDIPGLHVSTGWMDARVNFCDPGNEVKEDIPSGLNAAALGGMTAVGLVSDTVPPITNKSQVEYVIGKAKGSAVDILPYGTLTENLQGENLAEMYDLQNAGVIGFTDGHQAVSAGIMYRALLYARNFDGMVISFPWDQKAFGKGYVNEGKSSVLTGLKPIPSIAEYLIIQRDLSLLEYTEGKLHFTGVSTGEGVELIRQAKKKGLKVSADTYVQNLVYTEDEVLGFDSNYKVVPPLRNDNDRQALIEGLKDGTIDFVCSDHTPEDIESKEVEFDQAAFGMIGTQTLFSQLMKVNGIELEDKIGLISNAPRMIYGCECPELKEGAAANLTLFNPDENWIFTKENSASKGVNSPLLGQELKGKVYGIINKGIVTV